MDPKELLPELRTEHGRSRERLAEKMHVTRQAVSCWETGETVTNIAESPDDAQLSQVGADRPSLFIAPHSLPTPVFRQNVYGDVIALARLLYGHIEVSK